MYMCLFVNRPVRLHMDLETNMKMIGKRYPFYAKYTVRAIDLLMKNEMVSIVNIIGWLQ